VGLTDYRQSPELSEPWSVQKYPHVGVITAALRKSKLGLARNTYWCSLILLYKPGRLQERVIQAGNCAIEIVKIVESS
jgi:hypothetical protein